MKSLKHFRVPIMLAIALIVISVVEELKLFVVSLFAGDSVVFPKVSWHRSYAVKTASEIKGKVANHYHRAFAVPWQSSSVRYG